MTVYASRRSRAILVELLAAHLARRGLNASNDDELVFVAPRGGPIRIYAHATEPGKRQATDGLAALFQPTAAEDRGVGAGLGPPT
jgi:hypothetical protein